MSAEPLGSVGARINVYTIGPSLHRGFASLHTLSQKAKWIYTAFLPSQPSCLESIKKPKKKGKSNFWFQLQHLKGLLVIIPILTKGKTQQTEKELLLLGLSEN